MSRQLTSYLQQRANGASVDEASASVGMSEIEAKLTEKALAEGHLALPTKGENSMSEGNVAADQLRLFIERIERLEEEKKGIADDVKDVYAEAKANGYDTRTMREVVKLRKLERHVRQEREMMLDTYKTALGLDFSETPLGSAAVRDAVESLDRLSRENGTVTTLTSGDGSVIATFGDKQALAA